MDCGDYLDSDVTNAVSDALMVRRARCDYPAKIGRRGVIGPFFKASFDFGLTPSATVLAERAEL